LLSNPTVFETNFFSKKRRTFYFVERIKKESEILKGWPNKKCIDQTKILASLSAQSTGFDSLNRRIQKGPSR